MGAKRVKCRLCGRYTPDAKQNRLGSSDGRVVVCPACRRVKRGAVPVPEGTVTM